MAVSLKDNSAGPLGIVVVGFHHSKGSVVEFEYPEGFIVSGFEYLVHQALPDGAHNVNSGTVFFCTQGSAKSHPLPPESNPLFAVSCFRQIFTDELTTVEHEATRSTVQKAVCVVTHSPLYGAVAEKLAVVTEAYFNSRDLSTRSVLIDLYRYLEKTFERGASVDLQCVSLDVGRLFTQHRHKPLQIVKALLLGQTVMLYSPSAECASRSVLAVASLIPSLLDRLLGRPPPPTSRAPARNHYWMVEPYVCLQQMEAVRRWFEAGQVHLYGTANPLFLSKHPDLCDVFVDLNTGQVVINRDSHKPLLSLTLADLRFVDSLLTDRQKSTPDPSPESDIINTWEGSDDNIRKQFKRYIQSLFTVCEIGDVEAQRDFNQDFIDCFSTSGVLTFLSEHPRCLGLNGKEGIVDNEHPSRSAFSMKDIGLSLNAQVRDLVTRDQMEKVKRLADSTTDQITGAWTSVVGWWNSTASEGSGDSSTSTKD